MRKIYSSAAVLSAVLCLVGSAAQAQTGPFYDNTGTPIILPNSSSSYNQNGFNLPSAPSSHGQDIVRGSGGISCQNAIGNSGPQLDLGVIGSNDIFDRETAAFYGRVTVPLGKRPKRVDCSKLYDLEIERLKMELQLMRAGAMRGMADPDTARDIAFQASREQMPKSRTADESLVSKPRIQPINIPAPARAKTDIPDRDMAVITGASMPKRSVEHVIQPVAAPPTPKPVQTAARVVQPAPTQITPTQPVKAPPQQPIQTAMALPSPSQPVQSTPAGYTAPSQYVPPVVQPAQDPVQIVEYKGTLNPGAASVAPAYQGTLKPGSDTITPTYRDTIDLGNIEIANYGAPNTEHEYYSQLGVYTSVENAKNAWWDFTTKIPGYVKNYVAIAKPERKGSRTRYALQAGPFARRDAWKLCRALASDCYPAHVSDSQVAFNYAPKSEQASSENDDVVVTERSSVSQLTALGYYNRGE